MITNDQLKYICPGISQAHLDTYVPLLNLYMPKYSIDTKARIAPFLANISEESDSFKATREYASGQEYEGRIDLGNIHAGDGKKYRGRGIIQCTGLNIYRLLSSVLNKDFVSHPELLELPDPATESACWFWSVYKNINVIADLPDSWRHSGSHQYDRFHWIVILINGGLNGFDIRQANLQRALEVL